MGWPSWTITLISWIKGLRGVASQQAKDAIEAQAHQLAVLKDENATLEEARDSAREEVARLQKELAARDEELEPLRDPERIELPEPDRTIFLYLAVSRLGGSKAGFLAGHLRITVVEVEAAIIRLQGRRLVYWRQDYAHMAKIARLTDLGKIVADRMLREGRSSTS